MDNLLAAFNDLNVPFTRLKTKLYIPFNYDRDSTTQDNRSPLSRINRLQREWQLHSLRNKNFLESMDAKFFRTDQGENSPLVILESYELKHDFRGKHHLPETQEENLLYSIKHSNDRIQTFSIQIHQVFVHFFESGVAFLEVNLDFPAGQENGFYDYVQLMYRLKELRGSQDPLKLRDAKITVKHGFVNETHESLGIAFIDVIQSLLFNSFTHVSAFSPFRTNDGKSFISHTYTYLYTSLETPTQTQLDYVLSYGPDMQSVQYKIDPLSIDEYVKTFKTIYFSFSENGGILFVHKPEHDRGFFFESKDGLIESWQQDYSLAYLYLIHQRYALIEYGTVSNKLMLKIEELTQKRLKQSEKELKNTLFHLSNTLIDALKQYNRFMIRMDVAVISKHHHINKVYDYTKKQLKVQNLIDDIDHKMNHFQSYAERIKEETNLLYQRILDAFRVRFTKIASFISAVNTIFVVALAIAEKSIPILAVSLTITGVLVGLIMTYIIKVTK